MKVIRYSHAFKMQVVREMESGQCCALELHRKYGIAGSNSVLRWVRQFGSGRYGKIIRVEKPQEINQLTRLRAELRQVKEALADAHVALAVERAYLAEACDQLEVEVEAFKKKQAGGRRTGRLKRIGR